MSSVIIRTMLGWAILACAAVGQTQLIGQLPGCGGFTLAPTDDWDGDGFGDVVRACGGGQVLVVSSVSGATLASLTIPASAAVVSVAGTVADLDQDGHREVIVGDFGGASVPGQPGYFTAGMVAVWSFASPGGPVWQRGPAPWTSVLAYRAFEIVGDLDGDGVGDVAAGHPGGGPQCPNLYSVPPTFAHGGVLEILSGATGLVLRSHVSAVGDAWPVAVAAPGDVTGDGIPDYVAAGSGRGAPTLSQCLPFGAPLPAMVSRVTAFSGAPGSTTIWQLTGPPTSGSFVRAVGDFDGDGDADVLIRGNLLAGPTGYESVVDGGTGALLFTSQTPGASVVTDGAAIGDLNGDLATELLTPAPIGVGGVKLRSGGTGAALVSLQGVLAPPVPLVDLDLDGRVEYALQTASGQFAPGYAGWLIVSFGATTPTASAVWFGSGCGNGGPTPGIVLSGPPYFGWNRTLAYVNGPPGSAAFVFVGAQGPATPLGGGCLALLDLSQPITLLWATTLDGSGSKSTIVFVPPLPGLAGTSLRLQGGHPVPGGGVAVTAAIDLKLGF